MHKPGPAGISPRTAIGRAARYGDVHRLDLGWPCYLAAGHAPTPEAFAGLKLTARALALVRGPLEAEDFRAFAGVDHGDWSNVWQARAAASATALCEAVTAYRKARDDFAGKIGLSAVGETESEARAFAAVADVVPELATIDCGFALTTDAKETMAAASSAAEELAEYWRIRWNLTVAYPNDRIDADRIDSFLAQRTRAAEKMWPLRALARGKLRKALRAHFGLEKRTAPAPEADLDALRQMVERREAMDRHMATTPKTTLWNGLETDLERIHKALQAGGKLREAAIRLAGCGRDPVETRSTLARVLCEGRDLLEPGMPLSQAARTLLDAQAQFDGAVAHFREAAGHDGDTSDLPALAEAAEGIIERQRRLDLWCAWVEARREASAVGLDALVETFVHRTVSPERAVEEVETAYCRWVAPLLIDSRSELRRFSRPATKI